MCSKAYIKLHGDTGCVRAGKPQTKKQSAYLIAKTGVHGRDAASDVAGVSARSVYTWRSACPEFMELDDQAHSVWLTHLEQKVASEANDNPRYAMELLKSRTGRPEVYGAPVKEVKMEADVNAQVDATVRHFGNGFIPEGLTHNDLSIQLNREQQEIIWDMMDRGENYKPIEEGFRALQKQRKIDSLHERGYTPDKMSGYILMWADIVTGGRPNRYEWDGDRLINHDYEDNSQNI